MSLLFIDGFDHYQSSDITEKWPLSYTNGGIQVGGGRRGTNSFRPNIDNSWLCRLFPAAATWVVGMSMSWGTNVLTGNCAILEWGDDTTAQAQVWINSTGRVVLTRGRDIVLATSAVSLGYNTTYYLEWLLTIHGSTGVSTVRIDGIPVVSVSGVNTQATANASANRLRVGNLNVTAALYPLDIDDLYVCTNQTTFLGDCRVDLLLPTGEGSYSAWTPSTGGAHYEMVNETPPNDDTDYLSTSTVAARDMHTFADLGTMPSPLLYGVQHSLTARKDNAGTRQLKSLVKSGASTAVGDTTHTLASSYVACTQMYDTDPATGAAWTIAAVNGVEAGMEMTL